MYSKMAKKELEQECGKRGIVYGGLDKKELVKRLKEHEEVEGSEYEEVENDEEAGDEEQDDDGDNDGGENDGGNAAIVSDGEMKLSLLRAEERRFQAEERKVKAERERMAMEMEMLRERARLGLIQPNNMASGDDVTVTHSAVKLPTMLENEEALSYFRSFERTAILNGVEERRWARMLP